MGDGKEPRNELGGAESLSNDAQKARLGQLEIQFKEFEILEKKRQLRQSRINYSLLISALGFSIPLISLAISAFQFTLIEEKKARQQNFENYFSVIERLTTDSPSSTVAAASMYELKNYPEYCDISLEILSFYKSFWSDELSLMGVNAALVDLSNKC